MDLETVLYSQQGGIGIIRLNRPERMNAVIEQMYLDIQTVMNQVESDPEVKVLILTGTVWKRPQGDKQAFCAGADLKKHASGERTAYQKRQYIMSAHETTKRIFEFPKPIIAAINGPARGAGSEMALNCDLILMADTATIAFPETSLGTFIGGGVTYILPRLIGLARAKELVYTGRVLDGPAAQALGLALKSCPVENLMDEAMALAGKLAEKAPISMAFAKDQLQRSAERDIGTAIVLEAEAILACMTTEDWQEGIDAFAEKRQPVYKGK